MATSMDKLKAEEDRLDQELEDTHGDLDKMQAVFEKKIDLYKRFVKKDALNDMERLSLQNKKEWVMSHLLNLIIEKDLRDRITDLTKRVYRLEQAAQQD